MNFVQMKALKAFACGLVLSGLAAGCNEASQVAKTVAPEAEAVNVSAGKGLQSVQLTAEEREAKKREFFAKPEVKEMSAGLEEIAEAVAVAVEDKELRDRIYAKCMEKFDGETNVLWQQLEGDNNLRAKGGWNNRIDDLVSKGRKNTIVKGVGNVDVAIKKFEKLLDAPLHLFWMYPSTWDKKTTPLVAFVPFDMDPDDRQNIPAFDSKGNRFELDRKGTLAKQRPVIVIALNERTNSNGSLRAGVVTVAGESMLGKGNSSILQSNASDFRIRVEEIKIDAGIRGHESEWEGQQEFFYSYIWYGSYSHSVGWLGKAPATQPWITFTTSNEYDLVTPSVIFKYWEADGLWWDDWIFSHLINTNSSEADPSVPPFAAETLEQGHPRYQIENPAYPPSSFFLVKTKYRLVPKN